MYLCSNLGTYLKYTLKYTRSRFSILMYFKLKSLLEECFNVDIFILKLRSKLEVDFLNWCIYFQTQKYIWSTLSKLIYLSLHSEVYKKWLFHFYVFRFKLRSILSLTATRLPHCQLWATVKEAASLTRC